MAKKKDYKYMTGDIDYQRNEEYKRNQVLSTAKERGLLDADYSYNQLLEIYKKNHQGNGPENYEAPQQFLPGYEPGSDYFNRVNEPEEEKKPGRISTFYNNLVDKAKDIDPNVAKVAGAAVGALPNAAILSTPAGLPLAMAAGGKYVSDRFLNTELGKNITQKSKDYVDAKWDKAYTYDDEVAKLQAEGMSFSQADNAARSQGYKPRRKSNETGTSVEYIEREGKDKWDIADEELDMYKKLIYRNYADKALARQSSGAGKLAEERFSKLAGGFDGIDEFSEYFKELERTDRSKAMAIKEYAQMLVNDELRKQDTKEITEETNRHGVASNVAMSVISSPLNTAAGYANLVSPLIQQNKFDPQVPTDVNVRTNAAAHQAQDIRNAVNQNIYWSNDNVKARVAELQKEGLSEEEAKAKIQEEKSLTVGNLFYNIAMSTADSGLAATTGEAGALASMGANAYQSALEEAQNRGLEDSKAQQLALIAGAAEVVSEKIGLDNLTKISKKEITRPIMEIVGQAIPEGLEEGLSDVINEFADIVISGDKSEYAQARANGMSLFDYIVQKAAEIGLDMFAGTVSGTTHGTVAVGVNVANSSGKYNNENDINATQKSLEVVDYVADNNEKIKEKYDDVKAFGEKLLNKEKSGEKISTSEKYTYDKKQGELYQVLNDEGITYKDVEEGRKAKVEVPEEFKSENAQKLNSDDAYRAMAQATTPVELVEAYEMSDKSQVNTSAYNIFKSRMSNNGYTRAEFETAERMPNAEEAYRQAVIDTENGAFNQSNALQGRNREAYNQGVIDATQRKAQESLRNEGEFNPTVTVNGKEGTVDVKSSPIRFTGEDTVSVVVDGKEVKSSDIEFANATTEKLFNLAVKSFDDEATANAYLKYYPGNVPVDFYNRAFHYTYGQGKLNVPFENIAKNKPFYIDSVGENTIRQIYELGNNEAKAEKGFGRNTKETTSVKQKGTGKFIDNRSKKTDSAELEAIKVIAKVFEVDVTITDDDAEALNANGFLNATMGKVVINANSGRVFGTFVHEIMGEYAEAFNSKEMIKFQNNLLNWYYTKMSDPNSLTKTIKNYQNAYQKSGKNGQDLKTFREAADEMLNDSLAALFESEKNMETFINWLLNKEGVKEAQEEVGGFAGLVKKITDSLKKLVMSSDKNTQEIILANSRDAEKLMDQFLEVLDGAIDNYNNIDVTENLETIGSYRFSENVSLKYQIDHIDEMTENQRLFIGDTPQLLMDLGVPNLPLLYSKEHYKKAVGEKDGYHKHGLKRKDIVDTLKLISNPVMVFDSAQRNDSVVVVTNRLIDGDPMLVFIKPNSDGVIELETVSANQVTSIYGYETRVDDLGNVDSFENLVNEALDLGNILWINKKEIQVLRMVPGLWSNGNLKLDSDKIIHQSNNVVNSYKGLDDRYLSAIKKNKISGAKKVFNFTAKRFGYDPKTMNAIEYDDNNEVIPLSERFPELKAEIDAINNTTEADDNRLSLPVDTENNAPSIQDQINQSLTMKEAQQMVQRAFVLGEISNWFDGEYKNGDEWLKGEGVDDVAMIIENEYTLQTQFLDRIPGYLDGDFYVEDILEAYLNGTLTGKVKSQNAKVDTKTDVKVSDKRFYAPKIIENTKALLEVANQKLNKSNEKDVASARAKILLYAHNKGAAETLGITDAELNKKLRSWSGYSATARKISSKINENVALANRWTGIENVSWVNRSQVETDEVKRMLKNFEGQADDYELNYVARTMLAIDTHMDWSWLSMKFDSQRKIEDAQGKRGVRGYYNDSERFIHVTDSPYTVAHEMGHALDYQWGRDFGKAMSLTEVRRNDEKFTGEAKAFLDHFKEFQDSLTASSAIGSEYEGNIKETFARFVDSFVRWTESIATNRPMYHDYGDRNDKFTQSQYIDFAKLLQEKAALDAKGVTKNEVTNPTENPDIRYSIQVDDALWDSLDSYEEDAAILSGEDFVKSSERVATIIEEGAKALKNNTVDRKMIDNIAKRIIRSQQSTYSVDALADNLEKLFAYLNNLGGNIDYTDFSRLASEIAKPVVEHATVEDEYIAGIYKEVKDIIRSYKIKLSDEQIAEIEGNDGSVREYANFGALNINKKVGVSTDSIWSELQDRLLQVGWLLEDVPDVDQPRELLDTLQSLSKSKMKTAKEMGMNIEQASKTLGLEIIKDYFQAQNNGASNQTVEEMKKAIADYKNGVERAYADRLDKAREELKEAKKLNKEQKEMIAKINAKNPKLRKEHKEALTKGKATDRVKKTANKLINMLTSPTDKKHVPDSLREPVASFIDTIDFVSHRARPDSKESAKWQDKMSALSTLLGKIKALDLNEEIDGVISNLSESLDQDLITSMEEFVKKYGSKSSLSRLDGEGTVELARILEGLYTQINNTNRLYENRYNEEADALCKLSHVELSDKKERFDKSGVGKVLKNFFNIDLVDSISYFDGLGKHATSILDELKEGWKHKVKRIKQTQNWFEKMLKEVGVKDSDIRRWTGKKANVSTFHLVEGDITLTTGQIMSLYNHLQREQSRRHIFVGGIRAELEEGKGRHQAQVKPVHATSKELEQIIDTLTPQQKAVAEKMQQYLSTVCSEWGNNVSKKAYGYTKFTEEHYWPIKSNSNSLATNDKNTTDTVAMRALEHNGTTKALTPNATNALDIRDAFDVFTEHSVFMASYEGLVLPIKDALKWFNYNSRSVGFDNEDKDNPYQQRRYEVSIKEDIQRVLGDKGQKWFIKFIRDINGDSKGAGTVELISKFSGFMKASSVGGNLRVAIQQPTAYVRALNVLSPSSLVEGLAVNPISYSKKAQENSSWAWWKAQGYYDSFLGHSMKEVITNQGGTMEKIKDTMSILSQLGDDLTWGVLYRASEMEVKKRNKGIDVNSQEYKDKVRELFDSVIDQTQVVDTVFHRSDLMRHKEADMLTAFMMEPSKSYNMIYRAIGSGDKKKIVRALTTFILNAIFVSAAAGLVDRMRNDDNKNEGIDLYLQAVIGRNPETGDISMTDFLQSNLGDNLNPLNMLPVFKELVSALEGYDATRMDVGVIYDTIGGVQTIYKNLQKLSAGEQMPKTPYGLYYECAKVLSEMTGVPLSSASRDIVAIYNTINNQWGGKNIEKKNEYYKNGSQYGSFDKAFDEGDFETVKSFINEQKQADPEKLSSISSHLTSTYKPKLIALKEAGKNDEYTQMYNRLVECYVLTNSGKRDKTDAQKRKSAKEKINKWFEETK